MDEKKTLSQNGYEYVQEIGSGAYSSVLLCKNLKYNQLFAVKKVAKHQMSAQEYEALVKLDHPNIIKLFSTFQDEESEYLVMEYCSNGTLSRKGKIDYTTFIFYAKQILEALAYCHSKQIAHRDIKPENILLDQYNYPKLADFGLSKSFSKEVTSTEKCGTLIYCAPETLIQNEISPFKADIWALGITFFVFATGKLPFQYKTREELIELISVGKLNYTDIKIDQRIRYLINKMIEKNPEQRPTAEKLLNLPIFSIDARRGSHLSLYVSNKFFGGSPNDPCCVRKIRKERSVTLDLDTLTNVNDGHQIPKIRSFKRPFKYIGAKMSFRSNQMSSYT